MKVMMFAIRDRAVDAYMQPFPSQSVGAAVRMFGDRVNQAAEDNGMYKHPDDYDLYHVFVFDDNTGEVSENAPRMVAVGKDLVVSK